MNDIALSTDARQTTANKLNIYLASLQVFYVKLQHFHWNTKGNNFFDLHEKFEEMYDDTFEKIDVVAERIRMMGQTPLHTMQEFIENSKLSEQLAVPTEAEMVTELASDLNATIDLCRSIVADLEAVPADGEYADEGTIDELVGHIKDHEKSAWMLTSWLG